MKRLVFTSILCLLAMASRCGGESSSKKDTSSDAVEAPTEDMGDTEMMEPPMDEPPMDDPATEDPGMADPGEAPPTEGDDAGSMGDDSDALYPTDPEPEMDSDPNGDGSL